MATFSGNNTQFTTEIRTYTIDYSNDLPTGGTVTAGTATHIPPSGDASVLAVQVSSPYVYVTFSQPTIVGTHYIDVLATFSDANTSNVRLAISVLYPLPTARSGMADLIAQLRGMCNAGVNDYTIAGVPYWSDAQLQTILDTHRLDVYEKQIYPVDEMLSGSPSTTRYYLGDHHIESGTVFWVQDAIGNRKTETTDYSVDYSLGLVTFTTDTKATDYYATYRSYDLNLAAADVWKSIAAHCASMFSFSAGGQNVSKSDLIAHALQMASYYSQQAGPHSISIDRSDTW